MKYMEIFIVGTLFVILFHTFLQPKDDTDPPDGRSGLILYTDAKTGCQYLSAPSLFSKTPLTPRLGENGKQICKKDY